MAEGETGTSGVEEWKGESERERGVNGKRSERKEAPSHESG